jgi:arsenate reductase-like glutaredoxin family protein
MDIAIYGDQASPEVKEAQAFFERKGVAYDLYLMSQPGILQKMADLSGQTDRPVIVVNDRVFVGFDRAEMESAVSSLVFE